MGRKAKKYQNLSVNPVQDEHHTSVLSFTEGDNGFYEEQHKTSESSFMPSTRAKSAVSATTDDEGCYSLPSESPRSISPHFDSPLPLKPTLKLITEEDYRLASLISDESKKAFCSDMCLVFHAEFQCSFGRYFLPDIWTLMPLGVEGGACRLPAECECDVEIAKVRFECTTCGHCWTSMRGQISFFYHQHTHLLYFKLFQQACDRCGSTCSPLWYPEEVCRVMRNAFIIVQQQLYPHLTNSHSVQSNHHRRQGNPKGMHHGCESCRDGVCVALAAHQLGCKLII